VITRAYSNYVKHGLRRNRDGLHAYLNCLEEEISAGMKLLHLGCGRDLNGLHYRFAGQCNVIGADVDQEALQRYPGAKVLLNGKDLPFDDFEFDVVFCEYVLEHVEDPGAFFAGVSRVLKKEGCFIALAPNVWSYKSIAAKCIPNGWHAYFVARLRVDNIRDSNDVYPTRFLANSRGDLTRLAERYGLSIEKLIFIDNGPTWFGKVPILFEVGRLWHWIQRNWVPRLSCNFVVILRKR